MKKILFTTLFLLGACSVNDFNNTEEFAVDTEQFVTEEAVNTANYSINSKAALNTVYRDETGGSDWQKFDTSKYSDVWDWLIRSDEDRSFNYYTDPNGTRYWFNYRFNRGNKFVEYSIVTNGHTLQKGKTTVSLKTHYVWVWEEEGYEYVSIKFDVPFDVRTHMLPYLAARTTKAFLNNRHRAVIVDRDVDEYIYILNDPDVNDLFKKGRFNVNGGWEEGGEYSNFRTTIRSCDTRTDWRMFQQGSYSKTWEWLTAHNEPRTFNYYTSDGVRYWFNYKFSRGTRLVDYSIVTNNVVIQRGRTTVQLKNHVIRCPNGNTADYVSMDFDVPFDPGTHYQEYLGIATSHRGVNVRMDLNAYDLNNTYNSNLFKKGSFDLRSGTTEGIEY